MAEPREGTQSARKRQAILEAATTLFLSNGYPGTSMDQIAALAAVGKQTLYKHFTDKEQLFSKIILGNIATAEEFTSTATRILADTDDLERDLGVVARQYIAAVIRPPVVQLRRLLIGEAERFPELARTYYDRVPGHTVTTLKSCFQDLARRGLLLADDPALAASHFAWLVLGPPLNKATFLGDHEPFSATELNYLADAAVRVFLAAYGVPGARHPAGPRGDATTKDSAGPQVASAVTTNVHRVS